MVRTPATSFRKITSATNERTVIAFLGDQPTGDSACQITIDDSEPADISRDDAMALLDKASLALLETRARLIMDDFNEHRRRKAAEPQQENR